MDWDFLVTSPMPPQGHLLHGCSLEAERADRVASGLDGLRSAVAESLHPHMVALIEEIRRSSQLLRELADRSRMHGSRAPIVVNHLNVILPCLSKTLRDITSHYEDKTVSREVRWRKMYHDMLKEAGGLPLPQRFMMYNHFLTLLLFLLIRDQNYDQGQLELVRAKILDLRQRRGLPTPVQTPVSAEPPHPVRPPLPARGLPYRPLPPPQPRSRRLSRQETMLVPVPIPGAMLGPMPSPRREPIHWAEHVLSLDLVSRTPMKRKGNGGGGGGAGESRAYPPFVPSWDKNRPHTRRTLMRRSFDGGRLCVLFITSVEEDAPLVVIRMWSGGTEWYAYRGHHEICLRRDGNKMVLKRWSHSEHCAKHWAVLSFEYWEELVLFYCTFMALKARNEYTVQINPPEYRLSGETRLFQAQIIDDDYHHSLIVYHDTLTNGIRLHAAVWEGELRQCPVWTVFVTHPCPLTGGNKNLLSSSTTTTRRRGGHGGNKDDDGGDDDDNSAGGGGGGGGVSWLEPRGRHIVWLHGIQLYVFCDKYREANMRRNRKRAFEIYFVGEQAAARFREVFYPPASEPPSDPEREDHEEEDEEEEEGGEEEKKEPERITGTSSPSLLSES